MLYQSYHLYFTSKEIVLITQVEAPSVARATVAVAGCVKADSGSVNKFLVLETHCLIFQQSAETLLLCLYFT